MSGIFNLLSPGGRLLSSLPGQPNSAQPLPTLDNIALPAPGPAPVDAIPDVRPLGLEALPKLPQPLAQRFPQPKRGAQFRDVLLQVAPMLISAVVGRRDPQQAAAVMSGYLRGQQMAESERMEVTEREQHRKQVVAEMIRQASADAQQFEDPTDFTRYRDAWGEVIRSFDPTFDPALLQQAMLFPASKMGKAERTKARAALADLQKVWGERVFDPEFLSGGASGKPPVFSGGEFKGRTVRDVVNLAGLVLEQGGQAVKPPVDRNFQRVQVNNNGRRTWANYDSDSGQFFDLQGNLMPNAEPLVPGAPKSLQRVEVFNRGRKVWANYNPETGTFTDLRGTAMPDAQPLPDKPTGRAAGADDPSLPFGVQDYLVSLREKHSTFEAAAAEFARAMPSLRRAHARLSSTKALDALRRQFSRQYSGDAVDGLIEEALTAEGVTPSAAPSRTEAPSANPTGSVTVAELEAIAKRRGTSVEAEKQRATAAGFIVR